MSDPAILEVGYWCDYEGMYFGDESEIEEGHFGYECGEFDVWDQWQPHQVVPVAIVRLPNE